MKPEILNFGRPIGAEITGIDASKPLSEESRSVIVDALNRYSVVCLRGQKVPDPQLVQFCASFGELEETNQKNYFVPGFTKLHIVSNVQENDKYIGNPDAGVYWHSDRAYTPTPDLYTFLYALEVPVIDGTPRGNTSFASTAAAFEALPADRQGSLIGMRALQDLTRQTEMKRKAGALRRGEINEHEKQRGICTEHPLVRTHHVSGRKCLYLSEGHTAEIVGLPAEQSEALINELNAHVTQPQFIYSHEWQVGDLLIWDNVTTIHKAAFDYQLPARRIMHRAIIGGPRPV